MGEVIYAVPAVLAVLAAWDFGRRYMSSKGSAFEARIKVIELAQKAMGDEQQRVRKELVEVAKMAASGERPKLSKFQR